MKNLKKRIMICLGMLSIVTCLFFCGTDVAAQGRIVGEAVAEGSTIEIPKEVKEPVEKGKAFMAYIIISIGGICILVGLLFLAINFFGHQQDMKMAGIIAIGVGLMLCCGTIFVNWITGQKIF